MAADQPDEKDTTEAHNARMRTAYTGVVIVEIIVLLALWALSYAFNN